MDAFEKKNNFLDRFAGTKQLNSVDFMNIWIHYDRDASGFLDTNELERFLTDFVIHRTGTAPTAEVLAEMRQNVLAEIDVNNDGRIELGEFSKLLPVEDNFMSKFSPRKSLSRKDFNEIFMHYDPDGNGFIEGKELLALIRDILSKSGGHSVTLQEINDYQQAALQVFDKNTDRRLSRKELGLLLSIDR